MYLDGKVQANIFHQGTSVELFKATSSRNVFSSFWDNLCTSPASTTFQPLSSMIAQLFPSGSTWWKNIFSEDGNLIVAQPSCLAPISRHDWQQVPAEAPKGSADLQLRSKIDNFFGTRASVHSRRKKRAEGWLSAAHRLLKSCRRARMKPQVIGSCSNIQDKRIFKQDCTTEFDRCASLFKHSAQH